MFVESDIDHVMDGPLAHFDERVHCLSRLPVIAIPFMATDGFPFFRITRDSSPEPFFAAGSTCRENSWPCIHVVIPHA